MQQDQNKNQDQEEIELEDFKADDDFPEKDALDEIKKLKEKLKICESEKREYLDGWQRAKADFINARKEEENRRVDFIKFSNRSLVLQFLEVADSFDRAMSNKTAWESVDKNWRLGIENIRLKLLEILKNQGVEPYSSLGEKLDPVRHESVGEVPIDTNEKEGIIIEEVVKGYALHNSVIRPAQVKVGKYEKK